MHSFAKGLVNMFASWSTKETQTWRLPLSTCSRTKGKSKAMCLDLELITRFLHMKEAPTLSQRMIGGLGRVAWRSQRRCWIHNNSAAVYAKTLYSASVLDLATTRCLQEVQLIKFEPWKTANPYVIYYHLCQTSVHNQNKLIMRVPCQGESVDHGVEFHWDTLRYTWQLASEE